MIPVTDVPVFVTSLCHEMPGVGQSRHRLLRGWLMGMPALFPGRNTLAELARWAPVEVTSGRWRRGLTAPSGDVHGLVEWGAQNALNALSPPEDGVLTLTGEGSEKPTRGQHHPIAQKGRQSAHPPWFFGLRVARLIVSWEVWRLPVACRLIRPKSPPQ